MGVYERLKEQRDFLLENRWVNHPPQHSNEGCLLARGSGGEGYVGGRAQILLDEVLEPEAKNLETTVWNDHFCSGPGEAISVLEEAMRIAKERGLTDEGKE